jgi:hypothetical protein
MKINSKSWHAGLFKSLEPKAEEPSVCGSWFAVLVFMPLFYALCAPARLFCLVFDKIEELTNQQKWRARLGKITFH